MKTTRPVTTKRVRLLNGFTVQEIVDRLGGSIVGDRSTTVTNVGTIKNAEKGQIAFYSDRSLSPYISKVKASVVIVSLEDSDKFGGAITKIIVEKPHFYFSQVLELMFGVDEREQGISASAYVGTNALLSDDVTVEPHVIVEDGAEISEGVILRSRCFIGKKVKIGRNTVVHAGALILDECEIGDNCVIGITPNREIIDKLMKDSLMLVTALTPVIGYDKAAIIAKNANKNGTSIKEEAIKSGFINEKTFKEVVDPKKMIAPT